MAQQQAATPPALWDPLVRLSHWGLAAVVLANALVTEGGHAVHIWIGWTGMALLLIRLGWGLFGATEARFSAFPPNPWAALSHLADLVAGKPRTYASHNPAGAMMAYALWGTLAVVIGTGLWMAPISPLTAARQEAAVASGDWSTLVQTDEGAEGDKEGEEGIAKDIHELAANLMLVLAFLHVAGVIIESRSMRRNLVTPMLLGAKAEKQDV